MAEPADLAAADVAAHHAVTLAARERHEAVLALAMLSAKAGGATDKTCAQLEVEEKIAGLQEKYKGAVDAVGPGGLTPPLLACMQGKVDDVAALLALGADPTIEGNVPKISVPDKKYKLTPLMLAVRDGHVEIVRVLLAHERVDVNQARTRDGGTALLWACHTGHVEIIKLLLAHDGIDVNQASTSGVTPLFTACAEVHVEAIKLLVAHEGIDVNQPRTDSGITPLYVACEKGCRGIVTHTYLLPAQQD